MLGFKSRRELIGGGVIGLFGIAAVTEGSRLGMGTLADIGPGYFPTILGVLLVLLGILMTRGEGLAKEASTQLQPQWRGWTAIVLGVISFIVLGIYAGLVPATIACVFISAMGDRTTKLKDAILLAIGVAAFGAVVFYFLLKINLPLFGDSA